MADLLLDTHALLWWEGENPKLGPETCRTISNTSNRVFVSAASIWEIGLKVRKGKLRVRGSLVDAISANGFHELPISVADADLAGSLSWPHDDPFDRLLVAQVALRGMVFVTADETIRQHGGIAQVWAAR